MTAFATGPTAPIVSGPDEPQQPPEGRKPGDRGPGRIRSEGAGTGTNPGGKGLVKIKHIHERIIELMLSSSHKMTYAQIAQVTGYTEQGISFIMNSDAFRVRMAERRSELIDPLVAKNFDEVLSELGDLAAREMMARIQRKQVTNKELIDTINASSKAAAYGGGAQTPASQVVVFVPARAKTAQEWAAEAARTVDAATGRLDSDSA